MLFWFFTGCSQLVMLVSPDVFLNKSLIFFNLYFTVPPINNFFSLTCPCFFALHRTGPAHIVLAVSNTSYLVWVRIRQNSITFISLKEVIPYVRIRSVLSAVILRQPVRHFSITPDSDSSGEPYWQRKALAHVK